MRLLLTTLNARFFHRNLALSYLAAAAADLCQPVIREFTINDRLLTMAGQIYAEQPAVIGFSCYIWNIEPTLALIRTLKQVMPAVPIVCGGPEVSFGAAEVLAANPEIDYVVLGEGELTLRELLRYLDGDGGEPAGIDGLAYRWEGEPRVNRPRAVIADLDQIPSPVTAGDDNRNKIVYIESSRGCPYRCSFCLSSIDRSVRYFSMDRVRADLGRLMDSGVKLVKFVDRTFNADRARALAIWQFLLEQYRPGVSFHFEIGAHLLDEATLGFLKDVPAGYFQFEIGVQSTNPATLAAVARQTDFKRLSAAVKTLRAAGCIHLHLDLIAGLPYEDYFSFGRSFDEVFALQPHNLQLGFLKLLGGSPLYEEREKYGFRFQPDPPYEVLASDWISFGELLRLKTIEALVELYINSGRFAHTITAAVRQFRGSPFAWLEAFAAYWEEHGYGLRGIGDRESCQILAAFGKVTWAEPSRFVETLKLDLLLRERCLDLPEWCPPGTWSREQCLEFLAAEENRQRCLPHLAHLPLKEILRQVQLVSFNCDVLAGGGGGLDPVVLLFDYSRREPGGAASVQRLCRE